MSTDFPDFTLYSALIFRQEYSWLYPLPIFRIPHSWVYPNPNYRYEVVKHFDYRIYSEFSCSIQYIPIPPKYVIVVGSVNSQFHRNCILVAKSMKLGRCLENMCINIPRCNTMRADSQGVSIFKVAAKKTVFMHFRSLDCIFSYYNVTTLLKNIKNAFIWAIIQWSILRNTNMATKMASAQIFSNAFFIKISD